ncbi:LOW QUALITY PROTEIN: hypothetical protein U9M48_012373 [Paspalum notatum var. saurae]|uniref:Zinc finger PMZ-type domain-containing protein n=1 Tax=Paspalum notatum var. saurae TaxID=547442 RepID=A0AAQ3WIH8_PASNO
MTVAFDVVDKGTYKKDLAQMSAPTASSTHVASGVTTNAAQVSVDAGETGDCTGNSPDVGPHGVDGLIVDWDTLVIETNDTKDGDAYKLVDESALYQALGFEANDEEAAAKAAEEYIIPCMPSDLEEVFREAASLVDDIESRWDRDNPDMTVGDVYPSMHDFRMAVRQYALVHEFELGTEKSNPDRFRGYCKANGCPWKINAKTQVDTSVRVQIIKGDHNCASAIKLIGKMASQAWVEERTIPLLKEKPGMGAKEIQQRLHTKQRAAEKLSGKWDDYYENLYRFKAEIELRSPGSVVEKDTACIDGFFNGCKPYLSIDSTALNGIWNGHMPVGAAIDRLFPCIWTKEMIWFMEQLGAQYQIAIYTDACKGFWMKKVFPWAEQRECFRHLMENMKRNFTRTEYAKYMWPATRAYTIDKHRYLLNKAWNSWVKELKDLPLDCLADVVREKMEEDIQCIGWNILPAVVHQLNAQSKGLGHLRVTKGDPHQSEMIEIHKDEAVRRHVVYLKEHFCTYRQWHVSGKPCPHALAVITTDRQPNMEPFVRNAFLVQKLQAAYAGCIPNITDKGQWPIVDLGFKVLPPIGKKRPLGRQGKNKILGALERSEGATRQSKCINCGELGHRRNSWRCSLT